MINLELVSLLLIVAATSGAVAFVVLYAVLAPWHKSREGRHMMALSFGLGALGVVSVLRRALDEWPGYDVTVTLIYALIGWELWRSVWLLIAAQRDGSTPTDTKD